MCLWCRNFSSIINKGHAVDANDAKKLIEALELGGLTESQDFEISVVPEEGEKIEFTSVEPKGDDATSKVPRVLNALSKSDLLYREGGDRLSLGIPGAEPAQYEHAFFSRHIILRDVNYTPDRT